MILHYDFETSGIFVNGAPSNDPRQPRALSLAAILDDHDGKTRRVFSALIKPVGWKIDERLTGDDGKPTAFSVNGITNEMALKFGIPLEEALRTFHDMCRPGAVISAFNHHFDFKFLKIMCAQIDDREAGEAVRCYFEEHISSICTMEAAASHLIGRQRISLKNAYFELFKEENKQAHTSLGDAFASRRIFYELKRLNALPEPKPLTRKVYATPLPAGEAA